MSDLPIEAFVACDAEVERLRARVAELEESIRLNEDQRRMLFDASTKLEAERDSWKREAMAARGCMSHRNTGEPVATYWEWKMARAANEGGTG